jgi:hypothetical protein
MKFKKNGKIIAKEAARDVRGWSMGGGTTQICLNMVVLT